MLRAHSTRERVLYGHVVAREQAEALLQQFLARPDLAFVLARFAGYGCFAGRIERG